MISVTWILKTEHGKGGQQLTFQLHGLFSMLTHAVPTRALLFCREGGSLSLTWGGGYHREHEEGRDGGGLGGDGLIPAFREEPGPSGT